MPELVPVTVIRNGGRDFLSVPTREEGIIASLLRERIAYMAKNDDDGVAAVNAELAHMGYVEESNE